MNAFWLIALGIALTSVASKDIVFDYHSKYHSVKWRQKPLDKLLERLQLEILFGTAGARYIAAGLIYFYVAASALILTVLFKWEMTNVARVTIFAVWLLLPAALLEFQVQKVSDRVEQSMLGFLQSVHAGLLQTGDIIAALKYAESLIKDRYVIRLISRFNYSIQKGLSPEIAFEQLRRGSYHDYFSYVILNVEQVYQRRGDVIGVIQAIQLEHTAIQIELNKRRVELKQEKQMVVACMCVFLGVIIKVYREENYIWLFYRQHTLSGIVLAIALLAATVTLYVLVKGDRLKY
jgi:hypothetical protein